MPVFWSTGGLAFTKHVSYELTDQAGSSTNASLSCILGVFVSNIRLDSYYRKFSVVLLGPYKKLLE
jgi:hypothetical protein